MNLIHSLKFIKS